MKNILITGGAGFIGSHLTKHFVRKYPNYHVFNLDSLSYAGNLENLIEVEKEPNYSFLHSDITNLEEIRTVWSKFSFDAVIHCAAESHVDRSIHNPLSFVFTNVVGTVNLLQVAREMWRSSTTDHLFYHVSTDEVYGSLGETGLFSETTAYDPRSPYSASKASSDHFVRAYHETYGLPIKISNCSNNYGPYQFPEKLIPLFINNIQNNKPLPVYGKGINIRDWLFVSDHIVAIDTIFHHGKIGDTYNIGGNNEWRNIDLIHLLCDLMDEKCGHSNHYSRHLISFVEDRSGHDLRYAIDSSKIQDQLGWKPTIQFEEGLSKTIDWYLENKDWVNRITSGAYKDYYQKQYKNR